MEFNPTLLIDFYKVGHVVQYPPTTKRVWSNFTPRSSRVPGQNEVVCFGLQYLIKEYLIRQFNDHFFTRSKGAVIAEYREFIRATLGKQNPKTDHIEWLHDQGCLPVDIYAIPEGYSVPLNVPVLVITNTLPEAFWVPNYLETLLSCILWKPMTSATTAQRFRRLFVSYAQEAGEQDLGFVDWMGHDFSFRGMSGIEDAVLSGMAHLLSFSGTDTAPAILAARKYYGADLCCGGSVDATEHSVMCAGAKSGEFDTFRRLLTEVYPEGILSIVSDTWDLWRVLTDFVPRLKKEILARPGKLVIRPDSGDPVKIVCGDPDMRVAANQYPAPLDCHPAYYGTLRLLARALGVDDNRPGLPLIRNGGAIYGDAINYERADEILGRIVRELRLSPYNMVFGVGSFTYEYCTRDTYGMAMKATAVSFGNGVEAIYKDPVTDFGCKKSHRGIPVVYRTEESTEENPDFFVAQGVEPDDLDNCAFQKVFSNGELLVEESFDQIRRRVRA